MKESIAMRCTRENYESIKEFVGELKQQDELDFNEYNYLLNDEYGCFAFISHEGRKVYETFDKDIFLEACGIIPTLTKETLRKLTEPKTEYTLGNGKVGLGAAMLSELDIPFITISKLESPFKINTNLLKEDPKETELTYIYVKNLEGLAVLEEMVGKVRQILMEQNKLI